MLISASGITRAGSFVLAVGVVLATAGPFEGPLFAQPAGPGDTPVADCPSPGAAEQLLSGTVADPQGARVADALVVARCGGVKRQARTTREGAFTLRLPAGIYQVHVDQRAFDPFAGQVVVRVGEDARLDVTLAVAQVRESVTVRAPESSMVASQTAAATRTDTPLLEIPQSVTVVTAAQIRDQGSPNLQETLRYTPGVRNEQYGIDNRGDWITIRGGDASILLNSMRQPLTGWWGTVRDEPFAFESVAVVRGPASILAGESEAGGAVNMVSKRPQAAPRREVDVRLGNYDRYEIQFDATGPVNREGTLLYRLAALGRDAGTQVRHADEQRVFVAPSLSWRPSPRASLTAYGEYQYDESKNTNAFLGREGTLEPAPHGPIPTDLFIGEPDWDTYGGTRVRLGYEATLALGSSWRLRNSLRHDRVDGSLSTMYAAWWDGFVDQTGAPDANGEYLNRYWYGGHDKGRITSLELTAEGHFRTGGVAHTLLVGIDDQMNDQSNDSPLDTLATPLNVYAPVYGSFAEPPLRDGTLTENEIRRFGATLQDQLTIAKRLHVRLALRRDRVKNALVGGESEVDGVTTGNAGAVYEVVDGLAPYVSYAESFVPVSGTTFEGALFEPKRGEQVEAGLKWESRKAPVQVNAAYYKLKEKNRLAADPVHVGHSIQIGQADIQGVELEARGQAGPWTVLGGYTWTQARASSTSWGDELDPDQQLEGVPEHQASVWATHDFTHLGLPRVTLGGGARFVGRIGDGTGNVSVPSVTLFDLMGSWNVGNWRLSINANNLTDKVYIATCLARGDCWFGQRRTLSMTAGLRF